MISQFEDPMVWLKSGANAIASIARAPIDEVLQDAFGAVCITQRHLRSTTKVGGINRESAVRRPTSFRRGATAAGTMWPTTRTFSVT